MISKILKFIIKEVKYCLSFKGAFDFKGRASREQFLVHYIVSTLLIVSSKMLTSQDMKAIADFLDAPIIILLLFVMIYTTFIGLSAIVRRVHDYDGSVFLCLASIFVPIVGVFLFFYLLLFSKGIEGPTIYGPDPKGGPNAYNDWVKFMNRRNKLLRSSYHSYSSHKLSSEEEKRMYEEEERKREEEYRRQCEWQREQDEYYERWQKEEKERAEEERRRQEATRRMQEEDEERRRHAAENNNW